MAIVAGLVLGILIVAPAAAARTVYETTGCGSIKIITGDSQCSGTCTGITIVVAGSGNCHGADGRDDGQDGAPGCVGTTVLLPKTGDNCRGGDGGSGRPGGDGGTGCAGYNVNLGSGCRGGNGGNGEDA